MTKTLTDFYKNYRKNNTDEFFHLEQKKYKDIVKIILEEIVKEVQSGKTYKFPYNLGEFYIYKKRQKRKPIDWYNTKKYKKYIYHLNLHSDGLMYKYKWNKIKARFINKKIYEFRPIRKNARMLAKLAKMGELEIVKIK